MGMGTKRSSVAILAHAILVQGWHSFTAKQEMHGLYCRKFGSIGMARQLWRLLVIQFGALGDWDRCDCTGSNINGSNIKLDSQHGGSSAHKYNITLVMVSVGESGKLSQSLQCNKAFANQMIVLTSFSDLGTQRVCATFGVQCLKTNDFYFFHQINLQYFC